MQDTGHRMSECFYNPKSMKYKPSMKRTIKAHENLKKRKLIDFRTTAEECEFSFMKVRTNHLRNRWFIDSCSSSHLSNSREKMFEYRALKEVEFLNSACERGTVKVIGTGDISIKQAFSGVEDVMILKYVGYAPKCRTNLLSSTKPQLAGIEI